MCQESREVSRSLGRKAEECGMSEAEGGFSVLLLQYFCKPEIISKYTMKNHFVRAY